MHPSPMETVGQRIAHARAALGLSQEAFGKRLGVTRGAVGNWERDQGIKTENLMLVARVFSVPMDWLANGIGSPPDLSRDTAITRAPIDETDHDGVLLAPPTMGSETGVQRLPHGAIAEMNLRAGLGNGTLSIVSEEFHPSGATYAAEEIRDWWRMPDWVVRSTLNATPSQLACFPADGDSMEPTIRAGDVVFINVSHRSPSPDGIYAIADPFGGVQVKRIEVISTFDEDPVRVRILSDNPRHMPVERTLPEIKIVGRVVGTFSRK